MAAARTRATALGAAAMAAGMLGVSFAAVPLYRLFCQVTGFGGTTQRALAPSETVLARTITVRFDSSVGHGLPWTFEPVVRTMDVRIGENTLAFYRATNNGREAITGTAAYNVAPEAIGPYFSKIDCFCFTEQRLEPGETVEMPLSFFVDPKLVEDRDAAHLSTVTLSYTFYPAQPKPPVPGVAQSRSGGSG